MIDVRRIERSGVGILGLLAILTACYSTAARYFFPVAAPDWGDEVVVYLSVWALWLAAGQLVRTNGHVRGEFVVHLLAPEWRRRFEIVHAMLGIGFCATMFYAGVKVVALSLHIDERSESSLHLPLALYYAGMPVGMGLMVFGYALRLIRALRNAVPLVEQSVERSVD